MKEKDAVVTMPRCDLLEALSYLNCIVVSLDRIGSSGAADIDELTIAFMDDWKVFRQLARARMLLSEPFSRVLGEDDMDELEREIEPVPYWSMNARNPPGEFISRCE